MTEKHSTGPNTAADKLLSRLELPSGWTEVHVAVALSGGADSMALLRALAQLKAKLGGVGRLMALHVNHQLRGQASDDDAAWVRQQCTQLQIPLQVLTVETEEYATKHCLGIEAAARQLRYERLTQTAEQQGVRYLATAHTRDDQVETVLFRTLRGTGLRGLSGIPTTRGLTAALTAIRPMLHCSRELVIGYLESIGQLFRSDQTNADQRFTRNRLRHELLPQLREQYNPELDEALLRLATQAGEAQAVLECLASELLSQADLVVATDKLACDRSPLRDAEEVIVCEALRLAWRDAKLPEQAMTFQWWRQLAEFVQTRDAQPALNLPGDVSASIAGDRFVLSW